MGAVLDTVVLILVLKGLSYKVPKTIGAETIRTMPGDHKYLENLEAYLTAVSSVERMISFPLKADY